MSNRNRRAGHDLERKVVNDFKAIGYASAISSRMESKRKDDAGIDICNTDPFAIQCKNMQGNIDYAAFLEDMEVTKDEIRVVVHKKTKKAKTRFVEVGTYAILPYEDFLRIAELLSNNGKRKHV